MSLGAIVVVGPAPQPLGSMPEVHRDIAAPAQELLGGVPIASIDVLGRTPVQRTIRRLQYAGIRSISVVAPDVNSEWTSALPLERVQLNLVHDSSMMWSCVQRLLREHSENGVSLSLIQRVGAYLEFDIADLLDFHRDKRQAVTRLRDQGGSLDAWLVETGSVEDLTSLESADAARAGYPFTSYVNRLRDAWDLRRLALDALQARCSLMPTGQEVKAGVWVAQGAEVHRTARLVAPAYIGHGSIVRGATLITRGTALERNTEVDYGTVVEDASVLPETYVGAQLDLCHSVVAGKELVHLRRNVALSINDDQLIDRVNPSGRRGPFAAAAARMKFYRQSALSTYFPDRSWWAG